MFWKIILVIVAIIIIKFLFDHNKQRQHVAKQGGMRHKYSTLINNFSEDDYKIIKIDDTSVTMSQSGVIGIETLLFQQTFGNITVQWRLQSTPMGYHKLEWIFHEFASQNKMFDQITDEIEIYMDNVISNFK